MDVYKILWIVPLIPEILFIISLFYYKIRSYLSITFNSFYLIIINVFSLLIYHSSFEIKTFSSIESFKYICYIIFFFSYVIRLKRVLDFLSLSKILKSKDIKVKDKSKILYEKAYFCFELFYFFQLIILSSISIYFSYNYKIAIKTIYIIELVILINSVFLIYKISVSDMKKKFKKCYSVEILLFFLLFSNFILSEMNLSSKIISYQRLCFYLTEILFTIILSINYKFFSFSHTFKQNCLINKKLNSDFSLFINNELCFQSFITFIRKNKDDIEILIILKLYFDINKYTINSLHEENNKNAHNIIEYINNNIQFIKNKNLKEKLENIGDNINEQNKFDEIYKIIYGILNGKYKEYKTHREYNKLSVFLDLIFYLDEYIFVKPFYLEYYQNEELEII